MAVMCTTVPLVGFCCSVVQVWSAPRFDSSSSLYTHWNLCAGNCFSRLNRCRRALASGSPVTDQNSAVCMREGSILKAAPMEDTNVTCLIRVAVRMRSALSLSESMASMMTLYCERL